MDREYLIAQNDVCRRCLGEGVIVMEGADRGHGHQADPTEKKCNLCNGEGMVRVEKEIKVSITPKTPYYGKPKC